jgi:hypothetical protein
MKIWQRGTSISVGGSNTYTADRWFGLAAGANYTASQASYSLGGITKASLVISGAASNTQCDIAQRIESVNAYDLAGSVCTVSADVYTTDGTSVTWEAYSANATDNFSATTLIATGALTTTAGSYTSKTFSFTASSAVANGLEIRFKFGSLLSGKQGALGVVQLEKGSTATSFDYRPYGTELALCQRYYENTYPSGTAVGTSVGQGYLYAQSISAINGYINGDYIFKVTKRADPTVVFYKRDGTINSWFYGLTGQTETAYTPANISTSPWGVTWYNNISTVSANNHYGMLTASAEL